LRMPFPSMASAEELQRKEMTSVGVTKSATKGAEAEERMSKNSDDGSANATDTNKSIRSRANSDVEPLSPREKSKQRWAEIRRFMTAPLVDDDDYDENSFSRDSLGTKNGSDSLESVYFDLDDSPRREGSESPHTDPDFVQSSSDGTDVEWVLGTGMVGLKVSDSFLMVESKGINGVTVDFDTMAKEASGGANNGDMALEDERYRGNKGAHIEEGTTEKEEICDNSEKLEDDSGKGSQRIDREKRRMETRNISLAAGATAAMATAIWLVERKYDLS